MNRIASLLLFGMVVFGSVKTAAADVQYSLTIFDVPGAVPDTTSAPTLPSIPGRMVKKFMQQGRKHPEFEGVGFRRSVPLAARV